MVDGTDNRELPVDELRRKIGYAIQQIGLFPHMTVLDNIAVVPRLLGWDDGRIRKRVDRLLELVGLDPDVNREKYPGQLSGGQQQRVGIATALITSPRFIIADEPTTALDSITQRQIVDLLTSLVDDAGASMLFITHDFAVLARATTRCYVLDGGSIAETGTTASLLQAPASEPARRLVDAARLLTLPHGNSAGSSVGSRESARAQSKRETFKNTAIMRKDDGNE